jgi:flavin reductase (DIM6/NTAB) family NADH-FMN oxidoreductase RutF
VKTFNPNTLHPRAFYSYFTGILTPRPIAWILTKDHEKRLNIAPYSFFSGANTRPPMVVVSIGTKDHSKKDTAINIINQKEAVIHIVSSDYMDVLNASAKNYESTMSEVEILNLPTKPSLTIDTPQLIDSIAILECILYSHQELPTNDLFILEVKAMHINDTYIKDGQIDVHKTKPISRFMGNYYGVDYTLIKKEHPDLE